MWTWRSRWTGKKTLRDAHEVAERVHEEVEHAFPDVKHIMIHVNPSLGVEP